MCVNHLLPNQKLACCLYTPFFCFNFCQSSDWAYRLIILIAKKRVKNLVKRDRELLAVSSGQNSAGWVTPQSVISRFEREACLPLDFFVILYMVTALSDQLWGSQNFSVSLQKGTCITCVVRNKKKAEHSKFIMSNYTVCVGPWKKSQSVWCECVLMWDCPTSFPINDCTSLEGTCFHCFLKATEKLKPLLIQLS